MPRRWAQFFLSIAVLAVLLPTNAIAQTSISTNAWKQIAAIQREKQSWTPTQRKIESKLLVATKTAAKQGLADGFPHLRSNISLSEKGLVRVEITAAVTDQLLAEIGNLQGVVINAYPNFSSILAMLPLDAIQPLADRTDIHAIRVSHRPITSKIDTSEGDVAQRVNQARSEFDVDGTGIKIGVLSDSASAARLTALQTSGDLPAVTVLPGQAGDADDEGAAMLEIVHDLAPGAQLYFASAFESQAQFATNILALQAAGCNVIVDDVSYFAEPVFQDGVIAQAAETVTALGVSYFASAGNSGNLNDGTAGVYESDFAGIAAPAGVTGTAHNFGGGKNFNKITKDSGRGFSLQWSDEMASSANDYDLYLLTDDLTDVIDFSSNVQTGTQQPFEFIDSDGFDDKGNNLVIALHSGVGRYLHLNANRGALKVATGGQIYGHEGAENVFSIAAVDQADAGGPGGRFNGSESVEDFSSDGPRRVFYTAEGDPITPGDFLSTGGEVRAKPDFAAADGVSTATPEFETFFGTSAAAPHAAAIAALLLELEPGFTPADVRAAFVAGSIDIEAPGYDFDSGFGIINALTSLGGDDTNLGVLFIVAPFGGEKWKIGKKQKIEWSSVGDPGPNVKLELLRQGSSVLTIAASTPNDELFKWKIPNSVVAGNGYKVRVTSTTDPTIKDTSPFAFRIKHAK